MSNPSEDKRQGVTSTSHSLLVCLKRDEAAAWRDLVRLYSPLIIYWCRRQGAAESDCEDILQDVLRTVVSSIGRFRKKKPGDSFRGWLRTITRSRVIDHYRRQASEPDGAGGTEAQLRFQQIVDRDIDSTEETESNQKEEQALYLRAIELIRDEFQPQTWRAFWRTAIDGCTAADVADELDMRPGTVRVAKSRVLARLRDRLGELLE